MQKDQLKRIAKNNSALDTLTSREFEELVAAVLEAFGWQVSVTQATRDGGYDILAVQTEAPGLEVAWIVECKKYAKERCVGVEIVRGLYGVRDFLSIANAAIVTTAEFSRDALAFANQRSAIKLIDRTQLLKWIQEAANAKPAAHPPQRFQSVFISYSTKDDDFAQRLHARMREANMRVWFAPEDVKGGEKLHEQLFRAIQLYDKLLLVLSSHSLQSEWVMTEIRKAREVEKKEKRRKLFPIRLVDFDTLREWTCLDTDTGKDLAVEVREYAMPNDFSAWKDHDAFEQAFERLQKDLRAPDDLLAENLTN
jgi:Restriction endonuclease/TIR domain